MRGDILIIDERHRRVAALLAQAISNHVPRLPMPWVLTIAGESGSGKSELARALAEELAKTGVHTVILQQDDYFSYPPKTNDLRRREDISRVGPDEVRLDLLEEHIEAIRSRVPTLRKPLVSYEEDRIDVEDVSLDGAAGVIIEGTYTSLLEDVDVRVFIERTFEDTREERMRRGRDRADAFVEEVLAMEHRVIAEHGVTADILVDASFHRIRRQGSGRSEQAREAKGKKTLETQCAS